MLDVTTSTPGWTPWPPQRHPPRPSGRSVSAVASRAVSKFYRYGIEAEVLTYSPVEQVKRPKASRETSSVGLSVAELSNLIAAAAAESPQSAALGTLLAYNGLRITEALNADVTDSATVLQAALEEEMTEHLGHEKHHPTTAGQDGNVRNGTRPKTVLTDAAGQVAIEVPRDRDGTFEPVIVAKRQRRLSDVDAIAISMYAKGLTTAEISAHFAEIYGASISKDTVSRITDKVVEEMQAWASRPLQGVYAAIFIDAIYVKVRDGQVGNQPFYAAIGVDLGGRRDVLGLWAGKGGGESAKFWMSVLADLKNRGVADVFFVVCDGLKGLPDSVNAVFPAAIVQACVIHLIRATLRYASRKYWDQLTKDLRAIYTAPSVEAA